MLVKAVSAIFLVLFLSACGGGGGSSAPPVQEPPAGGGGGEPEPEPSSYSVSGSGVKGPLANAVINLYRLDVTAQDLAGEQIAAGTTNTQAQIEGITVTDPSGDFLMEFLADDDTIDLTTGTVPVLTRLTTIVDAERFAAEDRIYATPLTTLALNLGKNRRSDGQNNEDFLASLTGVQQEIRSSLGFGLGDDVDFFTTSPMLDEETITLAQQQRVTAYRKALEAFSAVVNQVAVESGTSADSIATALAEDLADGVIDASGVYSAARLLELGSAPDSLVIANDPQNRTVGDIKGILIDEKSVTGNVNVVTDQLGLAEDLPLAGLATDPDYDDDGQFNASDLDDDGDGVEDVTDAFPFNANESSDTDGDGIGDFADNDDDNDGIVDAEDPFPVDADETADADGDGIGNVADLDDDNDGVADTEDAFPLDDTESVDTDGDGIGNNADNDDDNDGVADAQDMLPLNADESMDSDGDGIGNNEDDDDDGDGVSDSLDYDPLDPDVTNPPVSSGGGGGGSIPPSQTIELSGGGIKGPLVDAVVTLYRIDTNNEDFKDPSPAGSGTTNAQAQIENLSLTFPINPPYIIEFTSTPGTTDLTTGAYPVITEMRSMLTEELLNSGEQIYATPLTTMAVDLAIRNAGIGASEAEVLAALDAAADQVKATMGFGIGKEVDIFDTPPLIDDSTTTAEEQADSAAYRSAVEAMTAVVYQMQQLGGDDAASTDDIIGDLADDLSDGEIDGSVNGEGTGAYLGESLDLFQQDPATLPIPNSNKTVGEVKDLLITETASTGSATDTSDFQADTQEIELKPAETNPDIDGDGVPNAADAFPEDPSADTDSDGDGTPDDVYDVTAGVRNDPATFDAAASDDDDDNDGVLDVDDVFPFDPAEYLDTDNDGVGNNADGDDDGDGVNDVADDFPLDASRFNATDQDNDGWETDQDPDDNNGLIPEDLFTDTDGDGLADSGGLTDDTDDDNDGVLDVDDAFPLNASESRDLDGDGIGNKSDTDIDGDGVDNINDRFPFNPGESIDTDRDGIGNNTDHDDDGDELSDGAEANLGTDPLMRDTDGDGALDNKDALPLDPNEAFDTDRDGVGNNSDNCKLIPNPGQANIDGDAFGDRCDNDDDGDGVADVDDAFPQDATETTDTDGDGEGNEADTDDDGDGVADAGDAFPLDATETTDTDNDGIGNNADPDDDNDGVLDGADFSPFDPNVTSEEDADGDDWPVGQDFDDTDNTINVTATTGLNVPFPDFDNDGLADSGGLNPDLDDDNDGVPDANDQFPFDPAESADLDGDTVGDNADTDDDGDGVADAVDLFPRNNVESSDFDRDGVGDNADTDDDNDGVLDVSDLFQFDASESADADADGDGDNVDVDDDNDGVNDDEDAFPFDAGESVDTDADGIGDNADNCPTVAGAQTDTDGDGEGNVCDTDDDNDGTPDVADDLPLDASETLDTDGDGIGNNADTDDDNDGVDDGSDAFPLDPTESADTDNDGIGDAQDNCLNAANAGQEDLDGDGAGDACDTSYSPFTMPSSIQLIPQIPAGISTVNVAGASGNGDIYFFTAGNTGRVVTSTGQSNISWSFDGNDVLVIDYVDAFLTSQVNSEVAARELVDGGQITQGEADIFLATAPQFVDVTTQYVQDSWALEDPVAGRGQLTRTSETVVKTYPLELFAGAVQIVDSRPLMLDWIDRSAFTYEPFIEAELTSNNWAAYVPVEWFPGTHLLAGAEFDFNAGTGSTSFGNFTWSINNGFLNITYADGIQQSLRKVERDGNVVGISYVYVTSTGGLHADYRSAAPLQAAAVDFGALEDLFFQTGISLTSPDAYDGADLRTEWIFGFVLDQDGQSLRVLGTCDDLDCINPFVYNQAYFAEINGNVISWQSRRNVITGEQNAVCDLADVDCETWRQRDWTVLQQAGNRFYVLESDMADFGNGMVPVLPPRLNFYEPYARADLDADGVDTPTDVFPFDSSEATDTDSDGFGDNSDNCVNDAGPQDDFDGDGAGDVCDADDDGDGTPDTTDAFPFDPNEQLDTDGDGTGNNADTDDDGDGISDQDELDNGLNPLDPADALLDFDGDGFNNLQEIQGSSDINDVNSVPSAGVIEFSTTLSEAAEGTGDITVNLHRIRGAAGEVSVTWDAFGVGNLTAGADYTIPANVADRTVTWAAGETGVKSFTIDVIDDAEIESGSELGRLTLSAPTGGAVLGLYEAQFAIFDNDVPSDGNPFAGYIAATWYELKVDEGQGSFEMEILRWGGSDGAASVDVELVQSGHLFDSDSIDVGAEIGVDVSGDTYTVDWEAGEAGPKRIQIPVVDDGLAEQTERLLVRLTNPTDGVLIPFNDAGVNIIDNDTFHPQGRIGFATRMSFADEAQGQVEVVVTRDFGSQGEVSVDFTQFWLNGEFTPINQTLTWPDGDSDPQSVAIQLTEDADAFSELFLPALTNVQGGALLDRQEYFDGQLRDQSQSVVIIFDFEDVDLVSDLDNDGVPNVADIDRDGDGVRDWNDAFPEDAAESEDSDGDGVGNNADAFPFDPSEQNDTDGDGVGDNNDLDPEDPNVSVSAGIVELAIAENYVIENQPFVELRLHRILGDAGPASVTLNTVDTASASAGTDYTAVSTVVNWSDGESGIKIVQVPIIDNAVPEREKLVQVVLSSATGAELGMREGLLMILSDDYTPAFDQHPGYFGINGGFRVDESAGFAVVEVVRYAGSQGEVSVDVFAEEPNSSLLNRPAINGVDFGQPANPTLTWADGEAGPKTLLIPIIDDFEDEGTETLRVRLNNPVGAEVAFDGFGLSIIDDDVIQPEGLITFVNRESFAPESATQINIDVARRHGNQGVVTVDYELFDNGGSVADDFIGAVSGQLAWADGEAGVKTISVLINDDAEFEGFHSIAPILSNVTGGARLDRQRDNNGLSIGLAFLHDPEDQNEGADIDTDGIIDVADRDRDGDGVDNPFDRFPDDGSEDTDSDFDGVGDNADLDDDNDGIPDLAEISYGLDPLDGSDAFNDNDADGVDNITEHNAGSDPNDDQSTPAQVADLVFPDTELGQCVIDSGAFYVSDLTDLYCGYRNITDLTGISGLTSLQLIQLDGFQSDLDFTELATVASLENLQVWNSVFDDTDLLKFQGHPGLSSIYAGNIQVTDAAFRVVMPSLANLEAMHLWGDWNATPPAIYDLSVLAGSATLRELAINWQQLGDGANGVAGNGVSDILNLPALRQLWLGNVTAAHVDILTDAVTGLSPDMEHISFYSWAFGNAQLQQVVDAFPNLFTLEVEATNVTDLTPILALQNLDTLRVHHAPIDTSIVDPYQLGINVTGNIANGEPLPGHLDTIADPTLHQCLSDHTDGMTNTGQLGQLNCGGRITELHGLWAFHNLEHLGIAGTPVLYLDGIQDLPELRYVDMNNTMIRGLGELYSLPKLEGISVWGAPLSDLSDYDNFVNDPNINVNGVPDQGELLDTIIADIPDASLVQCVQNHRNGATYAAELHFMDCSDYNGYNIYDLTHLDRIIGLSDFHMNLSHSDPIDFSPLFNLRGLSNFSVNSVHWDDGWSWSLGGMERIQGVFLGGTNISSLEPFRNSVNLQSAGLWGSNFLDLEPLFGLQRFKELYLNREQIDIAQLASLPHLTHLGVEGDLSSLDIDVIGQLDQLAFLRVGWTATIGNAEIAELTQALPNLTRFDAPGTQWSDLGALFDFNRIESLDASQTAISDFSLAIASSNLNWIGVDGTTISQDDINALVANDVEVAGTPGADADGDGVSDSVDAFPDDPSEQFDSDGDGVGDNSDQFPNDPSETNDADGDGVGDNRDPAPNDNAISALPGVIEFAVAELFVLENQAFAEVRLHRMLGDAGAVAVTFDTVDTTSALAGTDYTAVSQSVNWADGESGERSLQIPILDNSLQEGLKVFEMRLSAPTNGAELGLREGVVLIVTDDLEPALDQHPGYFGVSGGYRVEERNGFVTVDVIRFAGSQGEASVDVIALQPNPTNLNVPATNGQDFGQPANPTLTWAAGESGVKSLQIPIFDDVDAEGTEIINFGLDNAAGAQISWSGFGIAIEDDDLRDPEGVIGFVSRDFFSAEDTGPMSIDVARRHGASGSVTVDYQFFNGSADTNADFDDAFGGTLFWADNESGVKTIALNITNDGELEDWEYIVPRLYNVSGGAILDRDTGGQSLSLAFVNDAEDIDETADFDQDSILDVADRDRDGDSVDDAIDRFPEDGSEWDDSDGDGIGDNADAFENDSSEQYDADNDGIGDNADGDDDNDGIGDQAELNNGFDPFDPSDAGQDPDGDGYTNLQEIENGTNPYVADDLISNALDAGVMPDAELRACIGEHTAGMTYTSELTELYCSWRNITDLTGIDGFSGLQIVHVHGLQATGFELLANIPTLRELQVNNSSFGDAALAAFNGHTALEYVQLSWATGLTTDGLKAANDIPNLRNFNAWGPSTLLIDFADFGNLDLHAFSANRNQIVDLAGLTGYPNLVGLWIQGDIQAGDDLVLAQLSQLEHLSLTFMRLVSSELDTITANMNGLQTLEINNNNITDLSVIFDLSGLTAVNADLLPLSDPNQFNDPFFNQITLMGIAAVGEPLPGFLDQVADPTLRGCLQGATAGLLNTGQLTWLDCNYQKVSDINELWAFPNIEHLDISGTGVLDIDVLSFNQRIRELFINDTPVRDITVTHPMDTLQYLALNNALLLDPNQANQGNFVSGNLSIDGSPKQGADLVTIQAALSGDLLQCFNDNQVANNWQFAAEVHYLDCSSYMPGAYNVTSLAGIENLVALNTLHIIGGSVTDYSPIFNLPALESISIDNANLDDNTLQTIANGSQRFGNANIGGTSVSDLSVALGPAVNLYAVHLWSSTLYDLNQLFAFERLNLIAANTSQLDLTLLTPANFPNIRHLVLNGALTAPEVTGILAFDLHALGAGFDDSVDNTVFDQFVAGLPNLINLDVQWTSTLTDISSVVALTKLEVLNIANTSVTSIADLNIIAVGQAPPVGELREVNIDQLTLPDAEVTTLDGLGVQINGTHISAP